MLTKLLKEARRRGVHVIWHTLPPPYRSLYHAARNIIIITRGLTEPQQIEALAHELGHQHHGHDCTNPQTERLAWRHAAQLTFDAAAYARAEEFNPHPAAIALELDVTTKLVEAWQAHSLTTATQGAQSPNSRKVAA